jgi:hypothetical protein
MDIASIRQTTKENQTKEERRSKGFEGRTKKDPSRRKTKEERGNKGVEGIIEEEKD